MFELKVLESNIKLLKELNKKSFNCYPRVKYIQSIIDFANSIIANCNNITINGIMCDLLMLFNKSILCVDKLASDNKYFCMYKIPIFKIVEGEFDGNK